MFRSASEMREFNPKVDAIARMCDGAVDPSDNHLFPLVSPLPLQERLKIDHPNLYTRSLLCEACRSVLKYFAYVVEECKAHKKKAVDLNLLEVALHHETLITLFYSARAGCHLCFILSKHVKGPDDEDLPQFLQETQVEMCWRTELDERETFHGERIQFAVCKKTGPRLPNEYFTFVRLQIWPAKEFGHLFTTLSTQDEFDSMPPSSDGSKDSISDIISDTSSTSAPEEMNSTLFSSSQRSDREASDTNGAANNSDTRTASSICSTSEDSDGSSEFHPRMSQSSTGSASSRRLANLWLSQCRGNKGHLHDDCRNLNGDDQLPTRLIDIRHAMETSVARLVSPHRSPNSFITDRRFVTLSHCWGTWGREGIPVLNMANEQDRFKKGIALEQLPQTFQDAVEVADWLEVPWLWIDSLCIIQDSSIDWQHEALQMHSIYAQSYLNISADCAKDARDGLFQSRAAMAIQPLELHLPGIDETIHLSVDERNLFNWVSDAPLSQRAWVFQERHLARRILHFTEDEIVWECCAKAPLFASETFPNGLPLSRIFDNKPKLQAGGLLNSSSTSPEELYNLWEDLCQMYSEKNLSNASDKLIALFGLAKMFQTYFPDDVYVAGMWLSTLPRLLLWDVEGGPPITRITGVAPSWSWASIDGPIREKYRFKEPSENRLSIVCKVNISNSGSISGDSSESIQVSGLGIDGYIRRIIIHDNLLQDNVFPPSFDNRRSLILHDGSRQVTFADVNFSYSLDSNVESGTTEAHLLFVTVKSRKPSNRSDLFQGLLLHESQKADAFERIGTFSIVDNGAMKALVTALKYTVKEEIEDWEQAWEEFKDEHSIGRPRSIHGHSESGGSLGRSSLGEGDSVQSDAMQDESNNKNSNKSDLDLPIENLTLQTDESRSNVSDSDVSDSNVSDSNSTLDNHQRSTDEEISEEANDESEPDVGPNPDDTIQPDPADITAVLYDYEDGIDNSFFERLAPRKIVLI